MTVTNASPDTFAGALTGNLALTKAGPSTLTLSGVTNTYTGATSVSSGTLADGVANALPTATTFSVASGALFRSGRLRTDVATVTGSGTVTVQRRRRHLHRQQRPCRHLRGQH